MAGGMDLGTGGGKGKRPLDMAINLVPFIDLMAVTIAFLIMTAVWNQVGRLNVSQAGGIPHETAPAPPSIPVTLLISESSLTLSVGGSQLDAVPVDMARLGAQLKVVKAQLQTENAITLLTEDSVKYDVLVRVIDACVGADFPAVTVSPAS